MVERAVDTAIVWPGGRADVLFERFKQCIIDRRWLPGQPLNIDRLAGEYNVSITPVREALARLSADKLVVATPHRGYSVAPPPSTTRVAELFAVRLLLEPAAARGAAERVSPRDLVALQKIHEAIAMLGAATDYAVMQTCAERNRAFHEQIFHVNGNRVLTEVYDQLHYHTLIGHVYHSSGVTDAPQVVEEHGAILEALIVGDPDAAERAMRAHIERGSRRMLEIYHAPPTVPMEQEGRDGRQRGGTLGAQKRWGDVSERAMLHA